MTITELEGKVMFATYEKFGIRFLYPENWAVTDEQLEEWPHSVSVQSPSGAYWELRVYPSRISLKRLTKQAVTAMQDVYEDIESQSVTGEMWSVSTVGYDLDFFCLDFLVTSRIRGFYLGSRTCLLTCQAESREFEQKQPIFEAIMKSLLDNA